MNWNFPNGISPQVPTSTGGLLIHLWNKTFQVMITSNVFRPSQQRYGPLPNGSAVCDRKPLKAAKRAFSAGA